MMKKEDKNIKTWAFIAALFFTFGLVYLDFDNLSFESNMKPYAALIVALVFNGYYFYLKMKKQK